MCMVGGGGGGKEEEIYVSCGACISVCVCQCM